MRVFDYLALDGASLRAFLVVLEEGSVSRAAERLGVSQSAASHTLARLRDLDHAALPFRTRRLAMYLAWHRRDHEDPAHRWMRERIKAAAANLRLATSLA